MDIRKLQRAIVDGLEDVKAQDIVVFNTEHLSPLFERVVIASGTSNRQTKALAASVRDAVRAAGFQVMRTEGEDNGEWIIVDCAAAVVHVMQPAIRQYYQLEEIWGEKPVAIKRRAATGLVKASEPESDDDDDAGAAPAKPKKAAGRVTEARKAATTAPARKVAAKKAASKKAAPATAARKAPAKKAAGVRSAATSAAAGTTAGTTAARKTPARKAAAKKAAPIPKVVVNAPARKAAAKKVAAKKVAAKKVAAKKAPARAPAIKKVAAKKAPARKTSR